MTEASLSLLSATAFFVVSHLLLASLSVRGLITDKIGLRGHRLLFSIVSAAALAWMLVSYGQARYEGVYLWILPPAASMVPVFVMPFVCILIVCSVSSAMPTGIGGEKALEDPNPVQGISTITRHPMMVGVALWAIAHLIVNGDVASVILFGGVLVLAIAGMLHIDHRRQITAGSHWGPLALSTSIIPFLAAIQGRTKIDWRGIGVVRIGGGLALYTLFYVAHPWIAGVGITG